MYQCTTYIYLNVGMKIYFSKLFYWYITYLGISLRSRNFHQLKEKIPNSCSIFGGNIKIKLDSFATNSYPNNPVLLFIQIWCRGVGPGGAVGPGPPRIGDLQSNFFENKQNFIFLFIRAPPRQNLFRRPCKYMTRCSVLYKIAIETNVL